jgi:hypothetical protein
MNTCSRRFLLRLMIGILTFAIGVGAAMLIGGFNPFRSYSTWSQAYSYQGCHRHSRLYTEEAPGAEPAIILLKGPRGIRVRTELEELPPIPPAADAPVPPNPSVGRR